MGMLPDRKKYEQVILFFLKHFNNATMGRTKLVKLLYFLDFGFFEKHGRSITGDLYVKYPHGPVPSEVEKVIGGMIRGKRLSEHDTTFHGKKQVRLKSLAEPDMSVFAPEEASMLWRIAKEFENATAKDVEEISHHETPWIVTDERDYISYELATMRSPAHVSEARELKAIARSLTRTELIENSPKLMADLRKIRRSKSRSLTYDEIFS